MKGQKKKQFGKPKKRGRFTRDWPGKLLSLLIALVLYVQYQYLMQAEISFVLPLEIVGDQGHVVHSQDVHEITLQISGRANELENLRSSDFETYVYLTSEEEGTVDLPVNYRILNNNVQLDKRFDIQVKPMEVTLAVQQKEVWTLPIKVNIQGYPAAGFRLGTYRVFPETVDITGPASVLQNVESIKTRPIYITGKRQSFQELIELELPTIPITDSAANSSAVLSWNENLQLAFKYVQVEIQIDARSETKTFSIKPSVRNLPENLKLLDVLPNIVRLTLQGSIEILQTIEQEQSVSIDLDAGDIFASGRYVLPVVVNGLPDGISLLASTPNRVSLLIDEK